MFSDDQRPGKTFWRDDVFNIAERPDGPFYNEPGDISLPADGPFYNLPGYLDNFKVHNAAQDLGRDFCSVSCDYELLRVHAAWG